MKTFEFSDSEITYMLVSLRKYEAQLLEADEEEMPDAVNDLLFVQSLQKKLKT